MSDTYSPPGKISSRSAALQELLESKLRQKTDVNGSILYRLTWKHWDLPSGRRICALRAPAKRISVNGNILSPWPTTTTRDYKDGSECPNVEINHLLGRAAWLSGWGTPLHNTPDSPYCYGPNKKIQMKLAGEVRTTQIQQFCIRGKLQADGSMLIGSCAEILPANQAGGPLNPEHSRWLMGFPPEWASCAPTETRSISRRRKLSAKSSSTFAGLLPDGSYDL